MYAPIYRISRSQAAYATAHQRHERKRHRLDGSGQDEDENNDVYGDLDRETTSLRVDDDDEPLAGTIGSHSINRTDPYHVAGYSREESSLPPPPFPHAATRPRFTTSHAHSKDPESLNTSLHDAEQENPSALKRRHVDNLTTILHTCMLRRDWARASRAWALLLRTEIEGRGVDIRRHERWKVGAELLMRRPNQDTPRAERLPPSREESDDSSASGSEIPLVEPVISEQGFRLARQYYERLILQYPHTARGQTLPTALVFYPALFNIWVYEVQAQSKRALQREDADRSSSGSAEPVQQSGIHVRELAEALRIAERMDELLVTPDFDISAPLLQLRGMVGLWLFDLMNYMGDAMADQSDDDNGDAIRLVSRGQKADAHVKARREKEKALRFFSKAKAAGAALPMFAEDLVASLGREDL
nr:rna polymerase i-specific transcription initiation factor rrn11 [Quercus suber]